jgi:hypothetical protein
MQIIQKLPIKYSKSKLSYKALSIDTQILDRDVGSDEHESIVHRTWRMRSKRPEIDMESNSEPAV